MDNNENIEFNEPIYKVLVVGDPAVGQSELLRQFAPNRFQEATLGVKIVKQSIKLPGESKRIHLMFWDVPDQPQFYMLHRPYFNGADAVILFFDVTRSSTFSNINNWWNSCVKYGLQDIPRVLVGILNDENSDNERRIILPMAEHLSEKLHAPYFEVSLSTGHNIDLVLNNIVRLLLNKNVVPEVETIDVMVENLEESGINSFICQLEQDIVENMVLNKEMIIEIIGEKKTAGIVIPSSRDRGKGIIRLNELQRLNAGTSVGDYVSIRSTTAFPAEEIELTPITPNINKEKLGESIFAKLLDKPIYSGNVIELLGTVMREFEPADSREQNLNHKLLKKLERIRILIERTNPDNKVVKITPDTRIKIN